MSRFSRMFVALLLFATLVFLSSPPVSSQDLDPLADFRNAGGGITVPGGAWTPALQRLLFPEPPPDHYYTFARERFSSYPTLSWVGIRHVPDAKGGVVASDMRPPPITTPATPLAHSAPARPPFDWDLFAEGVSTSLAWIGDAFSSGLSWVVEHLAMLNPIGTASALCGDGASTCTWDNGGADGLWNTAANWSNDTVPAAGDSALFDATSNTAASVNVASAALTAFTVTTGYSATITVNLAQTATWGAVSFTGTSTGTVDTNGFAVTFGSFTGLAGTTLTAGASTITVNGNWNSSVGTFTFGTSTVIFAANASVNNATGAEVARFYNITVNASVTLTLLARNGIGNILTLGNSSVLTGAGLFVDLMADNQANVLSLGTGISMTGIGGFTFGNSNNSSYNIPSGTYPQLHMRAASFTATFTGDITAERLIVQTGLVAGANIVTVNQTGVTLTVASDYITSTAGGSWSVIGAWTNTSTSASWSFAAPITFNSGTNRTMTFGDATNYVGGVEFDDVTFNSTVAITYTMATRGLLLSGALSITDTTTTVGLTTSNLAVTAGSVTIGTNGTLTAGSSTITVNGNWDSSAGTFTIGTSTVSIAATASIASATTSSFYAFFISGGTVSPSNNIDVDNNMVISGGTYAKGTTTLNLDGSLTMSGGDLTSTSGNVSISGNVNISTAASAIDFGSEDWTVSGPWTNNTTDSATWDAGTGTVTFDSATGGTMTFAGANLAEDEFNNVTFTSSAGTAQTFTMATRSLRIAGTLTITDTVSTTTLDTSNLNIQANIVDCLANGIILIGTGDFLGLVTFNIDGSLTMDAIVVGNMYVNRTAGSGTMDITLWTAWTVGTDVDVRWTFSPSVAGDTWQLVLEDVIAVTSYDLLRNATTIDTQASVGTVVTLSTAAGWAAGDAMAIDDVVTDDGDGSIVTPEDVSLACTVRWPEMVLSCRASEKETFVEIANGIRSREWFVDGQLVPGSGQSLDFPLGRPWWSAELHRYQVAYKAYGNENVIGFAQTVAVLDMRSFVLLPLAFIVIIGAMWGTSKRMTSRRGSEDGDGDRGPPVRRRRRR